MSIRNHYKIIYETTKSEIIDWEENKIVKFCKPGFEDKYSSELTSNERIAGLFSSPKCFGAVEIEGKKGIIFEKIEGLSLGKLLYKSPINLITYAKLFAEEHHKINQATTEGLPKLKSMMKEKLLNGKKYQDINEYAIDILHSLPDRNQVCHGDYNLNNIIIKNKNAFVIDWARTSLGDPVADVARTLNSLSYTNTNFILYNARRIFRNVYLKHYSKLNPSILLNLSKWQFVKAVVSLNRTIHIRSEKHSTIYKLVKSLMKRIN